MKHCHRYGEKMFQTKACIFLIPALFFFCGKSRVRDRVSQKEIPATLNLPGGFLWGTATSSEQIEETGASDWSEFIRQNYAGEGKKIARPGIKNLDAFPEDVIRRKTDHVRRYKS